MRLKSTLIKIALLPLLLLVALLLFMVGLPGSRSEQCKPRLYPGGEEIDVDSGETQLFVVDVPFGVVQSYYESEFSLRDEQLPGLTEYGEWSQTSISDQLSMFTCYDALNSYDTERGCLSLRARGSETIIVAEWRFAADDAGACTNLNAVFQ